MKEIKKTLLIGLGNPILGDDGVGWELAKAVQVQTNLIEGLRETVEFDCLALGGLSLMERLEGYQDVFVLDAISTQSKPVGTIYSLWLSELPNFSSTHSTAIHDTSLQTAIEVGRKMGMVLPEDIWVVAVEAIEVFDFSDELSPPVLAVVPKAVELVLDMLKSKKKIKGIYDIS